MQRHPSYSVSSQITTEAAFHFLSLWVKPETANKRGTDRQCCRIETCTTAHFHTLPEGTWRRGSRKEGRKETFPPSVLVTTAVRQLCNTHHGQELRQRRKEGATQREGEGGRNGKPKWMCQYEDQARARKRGKGTGMRAGWGK